MNENEKKETIIRCKGILLYVWDATSTEKRIIKICYTKCANKKVKDKMATCLLITRSISLSKRMRADKEKTHRERFESEKYLPQ